MEEIEPAAVTRGRSGNTASGSGETPQRRKAKTTSGNGSVDASSPMQAERSKGSVTTKPISRAASHRNSVASDVLVIRSRVASCAASQTGEAVEAGGGENAAAKGQQAAAEQSQVLSEEKLNQALLQSVTGLQPARAVVWNGESVSMADQMKSRRHTAADEKGAKSSQADQVADKLMKAEAIARRGTFADGSIQQVETAPDEHGETKEERHARVKGISFRNKDGTRKSMAMEGGEGGMPFVSIPDMKKFAEHHAQEERDDAENDDEAHIEQRASFRQRSRHAAAAVGQGLISQTKSMVKSINEGRDRYNGIEEVIESPRKENIEEYGGVKMKQSDEPPKPEVDPFAINVPLSLERFKFPIGIYEGAMSKVLVAIDMAEKQPVVLRRYTIAELNADQSQRLGKEIKLLEKICSGQEHGLVEYRGCFTTSEHIYIVTENCTQGDLLRELTLTNDHKLPDDFVRESVLPCLLDALVFLHGRGIAHCDIKPENIFCTNSGKVKLGDLHWAHEIAKDRPMHREGLVDYMAPEMVLMRTKQERKDKVKVKTIKDFDEKVDIWQVGILAYELLTGTTPFHAENVDTTASLILWGELDAFPVALSDGAKDFIKQCLAKNPAERPTAQALKDHSWLKQNLFAKLNVFGNKNKADEDPSSADTVSAGPRQSSKAGGFMSWLVPGFTEMRFNAAETEARQMTVSGFNVNAKNHEYISEKDNTAVERGLIRVATALGLNKPLSPEKAEVRKKFNEIGNDLQGSAVVGPAARAGNQLLPDEITV